MAFVRKKTKVYPWPVEVKTPSETKIGEFDTTLGNLTVTHGTAAGNICAFSSTKVDIGDVAYGEADGVTMLEIPYTLVPSSANDEMSLVFT